jgi:predicted enzyme related to lactoylglutathione lyase
VHFEILGNDAAGLQQYYRDLFDWKITNASQDFPYGIIDA